MRNRAKCKQCNAIIESKHRHDYVTCSCGAISVDGGNDYYRCRADQWSNFIRIDDEGSEIQVTVVEKDEPEQEPKKLTKADLLLELQSMIDNIDKLPPQALTLPVNHYDFVSALLLVSSLFKAGD